MIDQLPATRKTMADFEKAVNEAKQHYANSLKSAELGNQVLLEVNQYMSPEFFSGYRLPRAEEINKEIDRKAWRRLMSVTGLANTLDRVAMEEFDKSLEGNPPEFSAATAMATVERLSADNGKMFARGLVEIFKKLNGKYKSHSAFKINKKMIITNMMGYFSSVSRHRQDMLNDLDRVLCALTGREYQPYSFAGRIDEARKNGIDYNDGYITVKLFKNNNAHIIINDVALIDRINGIISDWYGKSLA